MRSQLTKKNLGSIAIDALLFIFFGLLAQPSELSWFWNLLFPFLLVPIFRYLMVALLGTTPGLFWFQIRIVQTQTGQPPRRLFDWIFESQITEAPGVTPRPWIQTALFPLALTLGVLLVSFKITKTDPAFFAYPIRKMELFAPEAKARNWNVLAFYYASGAWPNVYRENPILYSLPYEKGPPQRFVGKIHISWDRPGIQLTLAGPLTLKEPDQVGILKACFTQKMKCVSMRREMMERQFKLFFERADLKNAAWFEVENPALTDEQKTQGLYFSGPSKSHGWIEAYYLVNRKMAIQGFILERTNDAPGVEASETLKKVISSQRMEDDLLAHQTWVNAQIARIKLTDRSDTKDLIQAQAFLVSKVSVDPKSLDSFYHLAGLSMTLFERAKKIQDIELTAVSKQSVLSSYLFAADIAPEHPKLKELDTFRALVKAP